MRLIGPMVSLTAHVAVIGAVVLGAVEARTAPPSPSRLVLIDAYPLTRSGTPETVEPLTTHLPDLPRLPDGVPPLLENVLPRGPAFPVTLDPSTARASPGPAALGGGEAVDVTLVEAPPVLLAGPAPAYPDVLRRAGVQGRVVLEAVIDTTGRVERGSIVVASTSHPAFVASAQRSLARTLFRPGRVGGRAVRVRVRVPIDFVLRGGD